MNMSEQEYDETLARLDREFEELVSKYDAAREEAEKYDEPLDRLIKIRQDGSLTPENINDKVTAEDFATLVEGTEALELVDELRQQMIKKNRERMNLTMDYIRDLRIEQHFMLREHEQLKYGRKIYPNELCPCGSGKKYKKCCGRRL